MAFNSLIVSFFPLLLSTFLQQQQQQHAPLEF
jgi:hypothetical protein